MFGSIVVGTDGSETANEAVRQATELAKAGRLTPIELVSAYEPVSEHAAARGAREVPEDMAVDGQPARGRRRDARGGRRGADEDAGVEVETLRPRRATPPTRSSTSPRSESADLIVVGNKGMTGAKRFLLGIVPNKVSHHAPCSVLIIRTT